MADSNADATAPSVVCRCGQRLNLRGATPGRVGSCPKCGARFQVGGIRATSTESTPQAAPREIEPRPTRRRPSEFAAYGVQAEPPPKKRKSRKPTAAEEPTSFAAAERGQAPTNATSLTPRTAGDAIGRGGFLPLPRIAEKSLAGSLRYPLWDGLGMMLLVFAAPILAVLSLIVFGALPLIGEGGLNLLLGPILVGFIAVFGLAFGYLLSVLSTFLVASAQGDIHHPRWPEMTMGAVAQSLAGWIVGWAPGLALVGIPAALLLGGGDEPTLLTRVIASQIVALGGFYGLVGLLSVVMHEDAFAASPTLVIPAMLRLGARLLTAVLLLMALAAFSVVAYRLTVMSWSYGLAPLIGAAWLSWTIGIYLAIVIMRVLGRAYHKKRKAIGWFTTKRIRREKPLEPSPLAGVPEI